ncbi:hypothetical protein BpHYR1_044983 [Brachionus plicatilis]|uniref:Uncharacterized protein n=1 Tax=Brachionus plicatilis TaxID=10195 RepID=A0A3M7PGU5_BRAPC|nr:hypothetical protein BpHYR1_044983 [Brachionus plicatilis]
MLRFNPIFYPELNFEAALMTEFLSKLMNKGTISRQFNIKKPGFAAADILNGMQQTAREYGVNIFNKFMIY